MRQSRSPNPIKTIRAGAGAITGTATGEIPGIRESSVTIRKIKITPARTAWAATGGIIGKTGKIPRSIIKMTIGKTRETCHPMSREEAGMKTEGRRPATATATTPIKVIEMEEDKKI